jgi:5'-nucleotidase
MRLFSRFKNESLSLFLATSLLVLASACGHGLVETDEQPVDFTLTLLHTNDVHSSFGGTTATGQTCYAALCEGGSGGYVRLDQAARAIRRDRPEAIFLEAGDVFQGTLFWTTHKEKMPARLLDEMGYQAVVPGNHEFDDGWRVWLKYVESLKTPVLAANVAFDPPINSPALAKIKPYLILERGGRKIGVIGLATPETPETSNPGPGVEFLDFKPLLTEAIERLSAEGVNIIIALTHLGLENDRRLARETSGVDVIVGGHSHSLLSNVDPKAEGPYPVVEKAADGSPTLIVTASTASVLLGRLEVGFDQNGKAREWRGEPIRLDQAGLDGLKAPSPNAALARQIESFAAPVKRLMNKTIGSIVAKGRNGLPLEESGARACRNVECLTGNITADALRQIAFEGIQISLVNGGALRNSLPGGQVTPGDVLGTLPFQNTPVKTEMSGAVLWAALEHGVEKYGENVGGFLQVSGLRYAFNPKLEPGRRVTKVEYAAENGAWRELDKKAVYKVVTFDFLARGGDGFAMFQPLAWEEGENLANDALRLHLERNSPIQAEFQGRITIEP